MRFVSMKLARYIFYRQLKVFTMKSVTVLMMCNVNAKITLLDKKRYKSKFREAF